MGGGGGRRNVATWRGIYVKRKVMVADPSAIKQNVAGDDLKLIRVPEFERENDGDYETVFSFLIFICGAFLFINILF